MALLRLVDPWQRPASEREGKRGRERPWSAGYRAGNSESEDPSCVEEMEAERVGKQ